MFKVGRKLSIVDSKTTKEPFRSEKFKWTERLSEMKYEGALYRVSIPTTQKQPAQIFLFLAQ